MRDFSDELTKVFTNVGDTIHAWVVLPNHYHVLLTTADLSRTLQEAGKFHGRTSFRWNGEEGCRGRQVWFNTVDRSIRSEAHFWASMNYIHHNAVRHGYVARWRDWPYSSALDYLMEVGDEKAKETWRNYPLKGYGAGWDDPDL